MPDPAYVRDAFARIADRYVLTNHLLSCGADLWWRHVVTSRIKQWQPARLLDVASGTGDLALLLAQRVRPGGLVLGLDAAEAPLELARRRARLQPWLPLEFRQGDALATGLTDGWADAAVMAYGLRNLMDPAAALVELRRLLRPGGRAAILDFNRPADPAGATAGFQRLYLRRVVVPLARQAGLESEYAYLEDSLRRFPTGAEQEALALAAGFSSARHRLLAGGQMGLLQLLV
jgi:demethylmenaquinone methyltransferase/2-methoxy-6-polyprenyl-1,4-benzoquinol methylase